MINLAKSLEFFDPNIEESIHIIGCGAIGSTLGEMLTRIGCSNIHLYDFDTVVAHNIANQMFLHSDIGLYKTAALERIMTQINPSIKIKIHSDGYTNQALNGYVFLCVDNIELRRLIVETNKYNSYIKAMFDFRMRLTDAQHYAASWDDRKQKEDFLNSMQFSKEEAKAATPVSACGTTLSIISTVRAIVSYGVSNFINCTKNIPLKKIILIDAFYYTLDAF